MTDGLLEEQTDGPEEKEEDLFNRSQEQEQAGSQPLLKRYQNQLNSFRSAAISITELLDDEGDKEWMARISARPGSIHRKFIGIHRGYILEQEARASSSRVTKYILLILSAALKES